MSPEVSPLNISEIVNHNLCIGCGLCSVACHESAITMAWQARRTWQPEIDAGGCTHCGRCRQVCPHSPQCIGEYAAAAEAQGERFGLPQDGTFFIAYDKDESRRIRSASGGVTSALLEHLLVSGAVDGVLASLPLERAVGEPHFQMQIFRSVEDLDRGRSSHYHPLCYDQVLGELRESDGVFAVVGVPCVLRGIVRLPTELQDKIRYKVCLVCSHNVTGAFSDCLAGKEGVERGVPWRVDLRDKVGIPDANNFNNLFELPGREIRRNRFATAFTEMWRNYYFAQECCFYCPDFFGADADLSVKDAWGRLSTDPLGTSLLIVRNSTLAARLQELRDHGRLYLEDCDAEEVLDSQRATAVFKQVEIRDRLPWKNIIRQELHKRALASGRRRWTSLASWEYARLRALMHLSGFLYRRRGDIPVGRLIYLSNLPGKIRRACGVVVRAPQNLLSQLWRRILAPPLRAGGRFFGVLSRERAIDPKSPRVLIAGGYGYGNVGDEAQLAANLQHWKKAVPGCRLTVLSPFPRYTERVHSGVRTELATRISIFGKGDQQYYGSEPLFKRRFFPVAVLCLFNAFLIRAGLPVVGLTPRQARLLDELNSSDLLFLSGGGYLTGPTLTRLWENMLLIRLAHALGVQVVMSGQTVGIFHDPISRALAKWGLKHADLIYLRDHTDSPRDLAAIGIPAAKINCTFDDALFFEPAPEDVVLSYLEQSGADPKIPYIAVNCHYWGQSPALSRAVIAELAKALDQVLEERKLQVVFVPMHHSDEAAISEVMKNMQQPSFFPKHDYEPSVAVGLVQNATLCLTLKHHPIVFAMAAGVPVVSVVFDDYYWHKNLGALNIFNQKDCLIDGRERRDLAGNIKNKLNDAYLRRKEISKNMDEINGRLKKRSGEAIHVWINNINRAYGK